MSDSGGARTAIHNSLLDLSLDQLGSLAQQHPNQIALQYGKHCMTWWQIHLRCQQFIAQLKPLLQQFPHFAVTTLLPNVPARIEAALVSRALGLAYCAFSGTEAVAVIRQQLQQQPSLLLVDPEYSALAQAALQHVNHPIIVLDVEDEHYALCFSAPIGQAEYEDWLQESEITLTDVLFPSLARPTDLPLPYRCQRA